MNKNNSSTAGAGPYPAQHTPGPWVWGEWTILDEDREAQRRGKPYWTLVKANVTRDLMRGPFGRKVVHPETVARAEGYETDGIGVSDADARLIAAAPELLSALRVIALSTDEPGIRLMAKEAIEKATKGTLLRASPQ